MYWCQHCQVRRHQGKKEKALEKSTCRMEVSVGPVWWGMSAFLLSITSRERKKWLCNKQDKSSSSIKCFCLCPWNLTRKLVKMMPFLLQKSHLFSSLPTVPRCYWVRLNIDKEIHDSWLPMPYNWWCSCCEWKHWHGLTGWLMPLSSAVTTCAITNVKMES